MRDEKEESFLNSYKAAANAMVGSFLRKNLSRKDLYWLREDLLQAAYLGVVIAYRTFDESLGVPIKCYVVKQIEIQILKEFDRINFISSGKITKIKRLYESKAILEKLYRRQVSNEELADFLFLSVNSVDCLLMQAAPVQNVSLPEEQQILEDRNPSFAEDVLFKNETIERLNKAFSKLLTREQEIIRMVYVDGMTLEAAGQFFGIRKQSLSEELQKILKKLKRYLNESAI